MKNLNDDILKREIEKATKKAESKEEYQKIIRVALGKWLKKLQNDEIKQNTVGDLKVLIEASQLIDKF